MGDHSIGYWIVMLCLDLHSPGTWAVRSAFIGWLYRSQIAQFLRECLGDVMRHYWLRRANSESVGAMQRDYMADQAALWQGGRG